jgi:hypothetical protein
MIKRGYAVPLSPRDFDALNRLPGLSIARLERVMNFPWPSAVELPWAA